jgi:hypothetical protein
MIVLSTMITLPVAWIQGSRLYRWGISDELLDHAARLAEVPDRVGKWVKTADGPPLSPDVIKQLEVQGVLHRVYENESTGQRVTLLLLVGPAGPLVRHPAEICYGNRGNRLLHNRLIDIPLASEAARLRLLAFESSTVVANDFFVAYGFGDDGHWDNPSSPRLAYAAKPLLYKIQVLTECETETSLDNPQGLVDFIASLLPLLNERCMAAASEDSARTTATSRRS